MDSFQNCDKPGTSLPQRMENLMNPPIAVTNRGREMRIQLDGSHTTDSATENEYIGGKKDVKFKDKLKDFVVDIPLDTHPSDDLPTDEFARSLSCIPFNLSRYADMDDDPNDGGWVDYYQRPEYNQQTEMKKIEKENREITEQHKQIMGMFGSITRNMGHVELMPIPMVAVVPNIGLVCGEHNYTPSPRCYGNDGKDKRMGGAYVEGNPRNDFMDTQEPMSMAATTSGLAQTIQCQTSFHEDHNIGQSSLITISTCTSMSGLQQSLNNYANAGITLPQQSPEEGQPLLKPEAPIICDPPFSSPMPEDEPATPSLHTVDMEEEEESSSTSSATQGPPLGQRVWGAIVGFWAAICLWLQVNRDCIFCLGFFTAFIVSASFLTAFFYRTLSVSPPLFPYPPLPMSQDEGSIGQL